MSVPRIVRRPVAVLAGTGTAVALALVPGAAHAQVAGLYAAAGESSAHYTGTGTGGTCDLTSGSASTTSSIRHFNHGTKHASADLNATYTNSLDTSDQVTVKGHLDSSLTLKRKHHDLSSFELTAGGSISINHSVIGSDCSASGEVLGEVQLQFTEHKKGYLTLTRDTKKPHSLTEIVIENVATGQEVAFSIFEGSQSHIVSKALLKPGTYQVAELLAGVSSGDAGPLPKSAPRTSKVAQTLDVSGVFAPLKH